VLELLAARMLLPAATLDDAGLLQRLERVERRLDIAAEHGGLGSASDRSGADTPGGTVGRAGGYDAAPATSRVADRGAAASRPAPMPAGAAAADESPAAPARREPYREMAAASTGAAPSAAPPSDSKSSAAAPGAPAPAVSAGPDLGLPAPPVLASRQKAAATPAAPPHSSAADSATGPAKQRGPEPASSSAARPSVSGGSAAGAGADAVGPGASGPDTAELPAADAAPAASNSAPGSVPSSAAQIGVTDVRRLWPQVLEAVKGQNRRAHALLESAAVTVVRVEGGVLLLSTQFPALARMVSEARNADLVRDALRDILGVDWRIRCVETGAEGSATGHSTEQSGGRGPAASAGSRTSDESATAEPAGAPRRSASSINGSRTWAGSDPKVGDQRTEPAAVQSDDHDDADYDPYSDIDPDTESSGEASYQVHDPSKAAIDLLTAKLGAHPIDDQP
jgi:DNA polymerase-3 subunit gamma/tau